MVQVNWPVLLGLCAMMTILCARILFFAVEYTLVSLRLGELRIGKITRVPDTHIRVYHIST